jgi:hypothetical protein
MPAMPDSDLARAFLALGACVTAFAAPEILVRHGVPGWAAAPPFCALAAAAVYALYRPRERRRRRRAMGQCVACGYDLRGNVSGLCPECGARARGVP